mgnify:CR=1 FL=1
MNKQEFDNVRTLANFLERYTSVAQKTATSKTFTFSVEDMPIWLGYYESLILTNVIPDGCAFNQKTNDTNYGVGNDGCCRREEFYKLLMQCYKYLYNALSSGEIFLKHNGWYLSEKEEL